jgi:hypothetical protein
MISKPNTPSGPTNGIPNTAYKYTTGGATSNIGDPVQYQFRWGIKESNSYTYSEWLPVGTTDIQISFPLAGIYLVQAKARCALHNAIQSDWSDTVEVEIETVSIPDTPVLAGDPIPSPPFHPNIVFTFETGGAASNLEHPVEYQFDWGDETQSLWVSPDEGGIASVTHKWRTPGTFPIKARARCKTHPAVISAWSPPLSFTIE